MLINSPANLDQLAVIDLRNSSSSLTYRELLSLTQKYKSHFMNRGLKKAILFFDNESLLFPLFFALRELGVLSFIASKTGGISRLNDIILSSRADCIISNIDSVTDFKVAHRPEWINIEKTLFTYDDLPSTNPPALDTDAAVLFTSGSTGFPKGIIYTNENLIKSAENIINSCKLYGPVSELLIAPISHSDGWQRAMATFRLAGTLIIFGGTFDLGIFLLALKERVVSSLFLPTPLLTILFKLPLETINQLKKNLNSIELGSTFIPEDSFRKLSALLPNVQVHYHYGLTECSRATTLHVNYDIEKLTTVGTANRGVQIQTSSDNQIKIKAEHRPRKVIDQNGKIAIDENEWLLTPDAGTLLENGYLALLGRIDDRISIGGHHIFPEEIKRALFSIQEISDLEIIVQNNDRNTINVKILICSTNLEILQKCKESLPSFLHNSLILTDKINRNTSGKYIKMESLNDQ